MNKNIVSHNIELDPPGEEPKERIKAFQTDSKSIESKIATMEYRDVEKRFLDIERESSHNVDEKKRFKIIRSNAEWMVETDRQLPGLNRHINTVSTILILLGLLLMFGSYYRDSEHILDEIIECADPFSMIIFMLEYVFLETPVYALATFIIGTVLKFGNKIVLRLKYDRLYHRLVVFFMDSGKSAEDIKNIRSSYRDIRDLNEVICAPGVDCHKIHLGFNPRISIASIIGLVGIFLVFYFNMRLNNSDILSEYTGWKILMFLILITIVVVNGVVSVLNLLQRDFTYGRKYAKADIIYIALYILLMLITISSMLDDFLLVTLVFIAPILVLISDVLFLLRGPKGRRF